ncbi:MAG TPA: Fic family protein [Roseomonas sp.]
MDRNALTAPVLQTLVRLPPPHAHAYAVVPQAPPADTLDLRPIIPRLEAAARALERVQTLATAMDAPFLVSRVLPRREAVSSSAVEGTYSTLDALLQSEAGGEAASDTEQVRDYARVLEDVLPRAQAAGRAIFDGDLLAELHRGVMRGDARYGDVPGAFRDRVVWIGGSDISRSTFNPPPPEQVAACLGDTLAYLRCDAHQDLAQSLLTRMAVSHAHFEAVHPFRDGNGRVGRLLLPLMMAAEGQVPIYLSPYIEANRTAYMAALKAAQQRLEWHAIIGFLADAVVATVAELLALRADLEALRGGWMMRRRFRSGSAAMRALEVLIGYPVVNIGTLQEKLGVSAPAAGTAAAQLMAAGILRELTGYRRNRIFVADEVLALYNRR